MRKLVKFSSVCVALAMSVVTFAGLRQETERVDAADSTYTYTFASGDVKTTAATKTVSNVTWSLSAAVAVNFDKTKGIQIGTAKNPQKTDWTISTAVSNFGVVKSVKVEISTAQDGGMKYTISAGSQSKSETLGATTSVTEKTLVCSPAVNTGNVSFTFNSNNIAKAIYIKSISVVYSKSATYTVSYNMNGSSAAAPASHTGVEVNDEIKLANPSTALGPNGEVFRGWNTAKTSKETPDYAGGATYKLLSAGDKVLYANWVAVQTYTVSFTKGDVESANNIPEAQTVESGKTATAPTTTPTSTGKTFAGWYLNDNLYDFNTAVTDSIELVAHWNTAQYTVTFNANGGSDAPEAQTVDYNTEISIPGAPTTVKPGCTFTGWNTQADGNGATVTGTYVVTENVTLYAQWDDGYINGTDTVDPVESLDGTTESAYISWSSHKGDGAGTAPIVANGNSIRLYQNGSNKNTGGFIKFVAADNSYITGIEFTTTGSFNTTSYAYTSADEDITREDPVLTSETFTANKNSTYTIINLKAKCVIIGNLGTTSNNRLEIGSFKVTYKHAQSFKVTYDANGADGGEVPTDDSNYLPNEEVTLLGNTGNLYKANAEFAGWSLTEDGEPTESFEITEDTTVYAVWNEAVTYTVTFSAGVATDADDMPEAQTVISGHTATNPEVTPTSNIYNFVRWYTTNENVAYDFSTPIESDLTITAAWSIKQVTVTYSANGGENAPDAVTQDINSNFTVLGPSLMSRDDDIFVCWNTKDDGTGTSYSEGDIIEQVSSSLTLYAIWSDGLKHDLITYSQLKATNNQYKNFELTTSSGAEYKGNTATTYSAIQLRSTDNSGVVCTSSIGNVRKVTISWNSNTGNTRIIDVYGSNTPYTSASDLYSSSTQGKKLGSLAIGENENEFTVSGDYAYVGIKSKEGAIYLNSIDIAWEEVTVEPLTVSTEVGYSATKTEEGYAFDNYSLRFSAVLDEERVEAYSAKENVTYGFAVIPTALLGQETLTVKTTNALVRTTDTLNEGNEAGLVLPLPVAKAHTDLSVVFFVKVGDTVAEYSEVLTVNFADAALALATDKAYLATLTESQQESLLALAESLK